ncbi:hypothetical protein [Hydrogenophaga sp. BPS33]|uniref:hypothetical protein n=1 Tax=Hydrogenophaga sp. BPS33 TaxID=2651974 RepID=UPI00131FB6E2|nr:hypothetical protein [Hydrogenophaga sp. BPS33]QHE86394.1 hypothetical protein F9K07_16515 [Hydrogenophaga sp. BPS33]
MMTDSSHSTPSSSSGLSRRRLVRAGLSAAPVVAALKSNSVLAGDHTCIRPSSFSSLAAANWKVSQGRALKTDYECKSHGYWKNNSGRLPTNFKETTKFLSDATGFKQDPGNAYRDLTIQQVLEQGGNRNNAALARHVAAAFLSARACNDDPTQVLLTRAQCKAIWEGQGRWSPFAGATWSLDQTMQYFEAVFGRAFL